MDKDEFIAKLTALAKECEDAKYSPGQVVLLTLAGSIQGGNDVAFAKWCQHFAKTAKEKARIEKENQPEVTIH